MTVPTFDERVEDHFNGMSPAEQRVARFFQHEEVLIASAAGLAEKAETSDATIVRTSRALGFSGFDDLRRTLADELRRSVTLSERMTRTLQEEAIVFRSLRDDPANPCPVDRGFAPNNHLRPV